MYKQVVQKNDKENSVAEEINDLKEEQPEKVIGVTVENVNYDEFKATLDRYYDKFARLIKTYKAKDDTIAKLSDEVTKYRGGFALSIVKPLCVSLISLREDCRKTLANIEKYCKDVESVVRYSDYLLSDVDEFMSTYGLIYGEDGFILNGKKLSDCVSRKAASVCDEEQNCESIESNSENVDEGEQSETCGKESYSFNTLLSEIDYGRERMEQLLTDCAKADENLDRYVKLAASIEENYTDAMLLPLYREIANFYEKLKDNVEDVKQRINEGNLVQSYSSSVSLVIDETWKLLIMAGVTVEYDISDSYDMRTNKIVKIVNCDDEKLDRTVAVRHTDCYLFDGKILYPSKVDVYKYVPKKVEE